MGVLAFLGRLGFASDKPDVVEGGERVGRCRFKAFPSRWWGAN